MGLFPPERALSRCLVIEDSRVMRRIECTLLEELQFETVEAEDGDSALQHCRSGIPELILLDIDLPKAGGFEFLRKLNRQAGEKRPVVVFCNTENDPDQISQALLAGANDYIQKPFGRAELKVALTATGVLPV